MKNTKVMKFGGSSVADAKKIRGVIDIVLESFKTDEKIIVVVSALGGITDDLIKLSTLALRGDKYEILFKNICQRHDQVVGELISLKDQKRVLQEISKKYNELSEILKNIFQTKKSSPSSLDAVMSFGEQLSAYITSEAMKSRGILCEFVDARTIIKTDDNFNNANVDIEKSYKLISNYFNNKSNPQNTFFVMGGFIGSTKDNITTTLGRGGSDYTASLIGAALGASVIEIWTDVDGIMTEDPKKMKDALLIPEITYEKAEEMAYNGAKVIHPKTMKPARLKNIPIYIKNTFNPSGHGTKIH